MCVRLLESFELLLLLSVAVEVLLLLLLLEESEVKSEGSVSAVSEGSVMLGVCISAHLIACVSGCSAVTAVKPKKPSVGSVTFSAYATVVKLNCVFRAVALFNTLFVLCRCLSIGCTVAVAGTLDVCTHSVLFA